MYHSKKQLNMDPIGTCFAGTATILTCKEIAKSFNENIYELSSIRDQWTPSYAAALKARVKNVLETYFINDTLSSEEEKRNFLNESMITALKDLGLFRAILKIDFKDDKSFVKSCFSKLGYSEYFSDAKNGDHYSLYKLLETFNNEMNPQLELVLTSKGVKPELINRIKSYSNDLKDLKTCFDLVSESDVLSEEARREVNAVYSQIKDICRITTAYYQFDPTKKDQFNFYKVMIKLKQLPIPA